MTGNTIDKGQGQALPLHNTAPKCMGAALDRLHSLMQKTKKVYFRRLAAVVLIVIALLPFLFNRVKCDQSDNYLARNYGQNIFNSMDKNGILFIHGESELFIAAYLKIVEGLRPDVDVYDIRQNIFYIPAKRAQGKEEVTAKDLYKFAQKMVAGQRPVYFTNPVFGNFRFAEYGVLYKVVTGDETPGSVANPYDKYNLDGIDKKYYDSPSKEIAGTYFITRARQLWQAKRRDLAGNFFEKALAAGGDRHPVLKNINVFYMQKRRYDLAEGLLKKAIKLNPFDSDDYNMLGMIYHYRADHENALPYYNKALALRGDSISALMNRAVLYNKWEIKKRFVM